jgi:hypothetical protein
MDRTIRKPCVVPRMAISHLRASYEVVDKRGRCCPESSKIDCLHEQLMAWHDGGARPSACPLFTTYSTESAILYASPALWCMPFAVRQAA